MNIPKFLLGVQAGIVAFSLLGYGLFTDNPELLRFVDPQAQFFVWAFHGLAILNMLAGGLAVVTDGLIRNGLAVWIPFALIYAVTLVVELAGTILGIPFGAYTYTDLLGPKWFGHVPWLIPLSWLTMAWPIWCIASVSHQPAPGGRPGHIASFPVVERNGPKGRWSGTLMGIGIASLFLTAWDLVLDPAMSSITSYWIWERSGDYYGMPWSNLAGWCLTGVVIFSLLARMVPEPKASTGFALAVYGINLSLPYGFCLLQGYWLAVGAGTVSLVGAVFLAYREAPLWPAKINKTLEMMNDISK